MLSRWFFFLQTFQCLNICAPKFYSTESRLRKFNLIVQATKGLLEIVTFIIKTPDRILPYAITRKIYFQENCNDRVESHSETVKWLLGQRPWFWKQSVTKMAKHINQLLLIVVIILSCTSRLNGRDIVEETSMLDTGFMRSLFHSFRDFMFRSVGPTSRKTRGNFLQEPNEKFPCDLKGMRSKKVPTSVHRLKPGMHINSIIVHLKRFFDNFRPFRRYRCDCRNRWFVDSCVWSYIIKIPRFIHGKQRTFLEVSTMSPFLPSILNEIFFLASEVNGTGGMLQRYQTFWRNTIRNWSVIRGTMLIHFTKTLSSIWLK